VRIFREKKVGKYLQSIEFIIEVVTTLPVLILIAIGKGDLNHEYYRFFLMQDLARTYLSRRLIILIDGEYAAIFAITNNLVFFLMWSSGIIQIFETRDNVDWKIQQED